VRKGHSKIFQQDIIDVLDKQLLEGMGVLLTEEEQQKCEQRVCLSYCGSDIVDHFVLNLFLYYRYLWKRRDCLLFMKLGMWC